MHEIILSCDSVCDSRVCLYEPYKRTNNKSVHLMIDTKYKSSLHTNVKRVYMFAHMNDSI